MIGKISGRIDQKDDTNLILDVCGIGYIIFCSAHTLHHIGKEGEACHLWIETLVQDGAMKLVGFSDKSEKGFFNLLIGIQGVGIRLALSLLGFFPELATLALHIRENNQKALMSIPGVGARLASRLSTELRERVEKWETTTDKAVPFHEKKVQDDAIEALVALGFSRSSVYQSMPRLLNQLDPSTPPTSQALVRAGLKLLSG